jgi:excisionase family DNA binding protein
MKRKRRYLGWVTVNNVAEYCLTSNVTIRRWIKNGRLRAIKLPGGHYRVSIDDFKEFLDEYDIPFREDYFETER